MNPLANKGAASFATVRDSRPAGPVRQQVAAWVGHAPDRAGGYARADAPEHSALAQPPRTLLGVTTL
jgi:hypothetical protein